MSNPLLIRANLKLANVPVCPVDSFSLQAESGALHNVEIWDRSDVDNLPAESRPDGSLTNRGKFVIVIRPMPVSA